MWHYFAAAFSIKYFEYLAWMSVCTVLYFVCFWVRCPFAVSR